ncbi:IclR family transcriptional regulator [Lachnospiraceae bacterium]|nr:IclR family transcriptional regulator [Lachnospiraceae bacterium]
MKEKVKIIQSVQRAIDIINCVGDAEKRISLREISSKLDLNINTTRGLVQTLLVNGFLSKNIEQGTYSLGYEFLTKSKLVYQLQIQRLRDSAYPHMERISEKYGVSSWLQISFYREIYTVEIVEPSNSHYSYAPKFGSNLPLHASASGKLRIAYMSDNERSKVLKGIRLEKLTPNTVTDPDEFERMIKQVYTQEYATELEEIDMGISCIAVPIFNAYGELKGTLSIAASAATVKYNFRSILADLKRVRNSIEDNGIGR